MPYGFRTCKAVKTEMPRYNEFKHREKTSHRKIEDVENGEGAGFSLRKTEGSNGNGKRFA